MNNKPLICDLQISPVPLFNARMEFNSHLRILNSGEFRSQLVQWKFRTPIHAEYIIWGGTPALLLNWFLQRAIIGIEAYIPSAVFIAGAHYGRLEPDFAKSVRDPFALGGKSAANTFYNCLPGLIEPDLRMIRARGSTWKKTAKFYLEIRNPLFHGFQLYTNGHDHGATLDAVQKTFGLFSEIYDWVDWWCPSDFLNSDGLVPFSKPPSLQLPERAKGSRK
jgi:hypothetical protein